MSEKIFKPVADAFALIHAGGAPYQWTTNAVEAVAWLDENPKYSVKEYVSLERYQSAVSDDLAALQQKLDAVLAESVVKSDVVERLICHYRCAGYDPVQNSPNPARSLLYDAMQALESPATDAQLNAVRAEGVGMCAARIREAIRAFKEIHHGAVNECADIAADVASQLRAETDTTPSQYESLAGGK